MISMCTCLTVQSKWIWLFLLYFFFSLYALFSINDRKNNMIYWRSTPYPKIASYLVAGGWHLLRKLISFDWWQKFSLRYITIINYFITNLSLFRKDFLGFWVCLYARRFVSNWCTSYCYCCCCFFFSRLWYCEYKSTTILLILFENWFAFW